MKAQVFKEDDLVLKVAGHMQKNVSARHLLLSEKDHTVFMKLTILCTFLYLDLTQRDT